MYLPLASDFSTLPSSVEKLIRTEESLKSEIASQSLL